MDHSASSAPGVLAPTSPAPRWEQDGDSLDPGLGTGQWREVAARSEGQRRGTSAALHWISDALAVVGPDPDGAIAATVAALPPEPGVVTVVGQLADPLDWDVLTDVLPIAVPPGSTARLAVSGVGAPTRSGQVPAAVLAEQLKADVVAPVGRLLLVPGGALFTAEGWRRFDGRGQSRPAGRRLPMPAWEPEVDDLVGQAGSGITAVPIPAGLWIYPRLPSAPSSKKPAESSQPGPSEGDLAYSIPMDPSRPVVLVGRPELPAPDLALVEALIAKLPSTTVIAPYGPGAEICALLTAALARRWLGPVELATGLPTLDGEYQPVSTSVDPDGADAWQPLYARMRCAASGPLRPVGAPECLADLPEAGPGSYHLNERWLVETTQSGLWVRPRFAGVHATDVRSRPWNPQRLMIVVGLPGIAPGDDVLPLLHALLARLPARVSGRIELVPDQLASALGLGPAAHPNGPDLALTPGRTDPPTWWQPDSRLFTVLIEANGRAGTMRTDAGEVEPGQLGEIIAGHPGRGGRPILLVAEAPVPRGIQERIADQVQAVVIGADGGGWWATRPRRVRTVSGPAIRLRTGFPLTDDDLARTAPEPGRPLTVLGATHPDDGAPLDLSGPDLPVLPELPPRPRPADPVVIVEHGPDWRRPFRLVGRPASTWEFAVEIARQRPGWTHRDQTIWLRIARMDEPALQLLANYLGTPVGVPADCLPYPLVNADGSGLHSVLPRRHDPPTGQGTAGAVPD